jgi:hypothetical protein
MARRGENTSETRRPQRPATAQKEKVNVNDGAPLEPTTAPDEPASPEATGPRPVAPFRPAVALLVGLPLALLVGWLILRMEQPENYATPTGLVPAYPVVVALLLLTVANRGARRLFGARGALSRPELLAVFGMMGLAGAFVCWENLGILVPSLAFPAGLPARGEAGSEWLREVTTRLPSWAVVREGDAALALLQGGEWSALWRAWVAPLTAWAGLLAVLLLVYRSLARLFFDPWVAHERLTLPLTNLPLELTEERSPLWSSRLFWGGVLFAGGLDLWNGVATFYPAVPLIPVKVAWLNGDASAPADAALGSVPYSFHPLMIGLAFLLPLDVLFSTWFFYLVTRVELYAFGAFGAAKGTGYMFTDTVPGVQVQCAGALMVLGGYWLWSARRTLGAAFRGASESAEARADLAIVGAGAVGVVGFLVALGLPLWAALLVPVYLLLMALFVTRLRAEFGLPLHNLAFLGPDGPLVGAFGGYALGRDGLTALSSLYAVTRSQQGHPMPHLMEGMFLADKTGADRRRFGWTLAVAGVLLAFLTPWLFLLTQTANGLEGGNRSYHRLGMEGWNLLRSAESRQSPSLVTLLEMGVGGAVTFGLILLRRVWLTSPLNPVGFAIAGSWNTMMVATPLFVAWLLKSLTLRYGGLRAYRAAVPLALGVVLGEFIVGTFWEIFALCTGLQPYRIWMF